MIYLYDDAIAKDLSMCLNPNDNGVRVFNPEESLGIPAQIQQDNIKFPLVALTRGDYEIDSSRSNFTRAHKGVSAVIDKETNMIYNEKALPIKLSYKLTILTTNQADMDEMIRELMFKYLSMYYLTIQIPYESKRKIRFGISINPNTEIEKTSGSVEYLESGTLYQSIISMQCEGCVLVTYTPQHLKRVVHEVEAE